MHRPPPPTAVLFDVGGVLLAPHPRYLRPVAERFGLTGADERFVEGHYRGVRAMYEHSTELDHWPSYHLAMAEHLGAADAAKVGAALHAAMSGRDEAERWWTYVLPGALDTLRELHRRGVPIGIVSNADGLVAHDLVETALCQVGEGHGVPVAVVVDSAVVGVAKPDPAIFDHAFDALDAHVGTALDRSRVLYVGDTVRNDVRGAAAAGLRPVQLDPLQLHVDCDHDRLGRLDELLDWF